MENLHIPWSDIMGMWYYDLELCIDTYAKMLEDRKKAEEENSNEGSQSDMQRKYSPDNMMKQAQSMIPKMPGFKMPKL